jgi:hypothetical protein
VHQPTPRTAKERVFAVRGAPRGTPNGTAAALAGIKVLVPDHQEQRRRHDTDQQRKNRGFSEAFLTHKYHEKTHLRPCGSGHLLGPALWN